jgi:hypothetical protein
MADAQKVITGEVRLSFPHLFVARQGPSGGDPKFSCALILPEGYDISPLQVAVMTAAQEKWGDKAGGMFSAQKLRNPIRRDWEDKGYPENSVFINCSTKQAPEIVGAYLDPATGQPEVITDPTRCYPGVYCRASIRAFPYDINGNKGVAFGLNNLQILRDGPRLDSRVSAVNEFDAVERPYADMGSDPNEDAEMRSMLGMGTKGSGSAAGASSL